MIKTLPFSNFSKEFVKKKFFLVVILISLSINILNLKNYGYAWDAGLQRMTGFVNLKHIIKIFVPEIEKKYERLKKVPDLNSWRDRYYGPSFELFASSVEVITGNISNIKSEDNTKNIYYLRCFLLIIILHLFYFFFYKTNLYLTKNIFISNLILLLLLSYPRFFAEQHYNSKDLYLCGLAIMTSYFGFKLIIKNKLKYVIFFTFFSALSISMKMSFIFIPSLIILFHFLNNKNFNLNNLYFYLLNLILVLFFLYISFPFLWENPIINIIEVYNKISNHSWNGDVLYFGEIYKNNETPWHYILVWFIITTPLIYLIFFLFATFYVFKLLLNLKNLDINFINNFILLNFFIFLITLFLVIIFQNNTYNGWRHSYFIFIFFLMFIGCYVSTISSKLKLYLSKILIIILILMNFNWIYKNHPYQNLYFNILIKDPEKNFDLDWWGLTYNEVVQYLLKIDKSDKINLFSASGTSIEATRKNLLTKEQMSRINVVNSEKDADYISNNFIGNTQNEKFKNNFKIIKQIKVSGNPVNTILKRK